MHASNLSMRAHRHHHSTLLLQGSSGRVTVKKSVRIIEEIGSGRCDVKPRNLPRLPGKYPCATCRKTGSQAGVFPCHTLCHNNSTKSSVPSFGAAVLDVMG